MDKDYYITECLKILRDTTTYSPQPSPPSPMTLHSHLAKILIKHNTPPSLIKYILHIDKPPRHAIFYILLKLHKNPVVGRPIVSSIGTITFNASRYLDHILQPLMKSSFSFIRNSTDLVTRLEATPFPTSATLCSADVVNLYPSIDLHDGLRMLHIALHISPFRIDNIPLLMDLAQFILFNNYLSFDDQVYLQLQGTAMGTPFAVTFACIYMSMLEIETLRLCRSTDTSSFIPPILLCRFIDDIFSVFQDPISAALFFNTFNTLRPSIKLTFDITSPSHSFLDLTIFKGPRFHTSNLLDTKLYQKQINKYQYISPNSFHPRHVFSNFIHAELRRYLLACTHPDDFIHLRSQFSSRLTARGYPPLFINSLFKSFTLTRNQLLHSQPTPSPFTIPSITNPFLPTTLPYPQPLSPPLTYICKHNSRLHASSIRHCLSLPSYITEDPTLHALFHNRPPIICQKKAPSLNDKLVRSILTTSVNS